MSNTEKWKRRAIKALMEGDKEKYTLAMKEFFAAALLSKPDAELEALDKERKRCGRLTLFCRCVFHWRLSPIPEAISKELGYDIIEWKGDCPFKGRESECPAYINPMEV